MENQTELNIGLGTKEPEKKILAPAKVTIVSVAVESLAKAKKVVFIVKHPAKEETIKISSVSMLVDRVVKTVGTWLNLDSDGLLQKGSALHTFLAKIGCENINQSIGKEVDTELDGNYLAFKVF